MADFINGVRVTINMREDTSKTNYKSTYGKMIPGKSYVIIDAKYEIQKNVNFTFGEINHGNYTSFIGSDYKDLETEYDLIDFKTYKDITNDDGMRIISFTSKSIISRQLDNYGMKNYITYSVSIGYGNNILYSIPISELDMYPYVKPNLEFIKAIRNNNKINITVKLLMFLKKGFYTNDNFIECYIKKNIDNDYSKTIIEDVNFLKSINLEIGELYNDFITFTIINVEDDSYTGYFRINILNDILTFPFFKIPSRYQLICFGGNGDRIAFGKICEQEGFENNLDSWFYKPTHFIEQVDFSKPPNGIPSDTIIITGTLDSSEMIQMNFGDTMGNNPLTEKDDEMYSYKQTFWLLPSKYDKTINDFLNNCIIEMFLEQPCPSICPRLYYRNYGDDIEIQVLSMTKNIKTTKIRLRFTFSDVFTY